MLANWPYVQNSTAEYSPCAQYRYALCRYWDQDKPPVAFIGLNPSTATEEHDDPTVHRCVDFAYRWGFGGMLMLNAFALRATDPRKLYVHSDPVGADCDEALLRWSAKAGQVIGAWGQHGALHQRGDALRTLLQGTNLHCLGTTKAGHPRHPLYLKRDTERIPFT